MADIEEDQALLAAEAGDEDSLSGVEESGRVGTPLPAICDPAHVLHRVVVLVFMCFLGFGKHEKAQTWSVGVI